MSQDDLSVANDPSARRSFLTRASAIVIGAMVTLFPFVAGWGVFTDPLRRKQPSADGDESETAGLVRVCTLDSLPADGVPHAFPVIADVADAWTRAPGQRIGEVYLSRKDASGEPQITAFTAACPHLGCAVEFDSADSRFECPCHESAFALDGARLFGPSLRGLDQLDVKLVGESASREIWVKFQRFRAAIAERTPVG